MDKSAPPAHRSPPPLTGLAGRLPHDLDQTLLAPFLKGNTSEAIKAGTILYRQGEAANRFAWIEEGLVELFVTNDAGEELQLDMAARGAMLGDIAAANGTRHLTSARTLTPSRLCWIDAAQFQERLTCDGRMVLGTLAGLCLRLRRLVQQIDAMKLRSGTRRLAGFLLELGGKDVGAVSLTLPFEKKALARHLGMTNQSLSRSLKALRELGVTVKGSAIRLQDCKRLGDFCSKEGDGL
ncbi:MAG: Crp/Fnr family transcriptional regulator [Alphaproteobacteria bacterium]|nr:Crp/Fnr family transcriptional regulator [Alphaproteobacteria bacterium]MBF0354392.1 Crp/Fnr family transcriptional regulator [Alphaproteobacteria bacterium]